MVNAPVNATGWSYLMDGKMIKAVYTMYDASFGNLGIIVVILFVVYQSMLWTKTKNLTLMWITGMIFGSMYALSTFAEAFSMRIIFLILVFELAGILYLLLFNK